MDVHFYTISVPTFLRHLHLTSYIPYIAVPATMVPTLHLSSYIPFTAVPIFLRLQFLHSLHWFLHLHLSFYIPYTAVHTFLTMAPTSDPHRSPNSVDYHKDSGQIRGLFSHPSQALMAYNESGPRS